MTRSPSRLLLVGSGSIAVRHARVWRQVVEGAGIARLAADGRPPSDERVGALTDVVVTSWDDALAWAPDVAVIANAAPGHPSALERLVDAGVPTLVEKPLAMSAAAVDGLGARADDLGVPVLVGYVLRHHVLVRRLLEVVAGGELGRVLAVRAHVGQHLADWRPGRDMASTVTARRDMGGGALLELSHEIDLALAIAGAPESVSARLTATRTLGIEVEDIVDVLIDHRSGGVSAVHLNLIERPARRTLAVVGDSGSAELDLVGGLLSWSGSDGVHTVRSADFPGADMYETQALHLVDVAARRAAPVVSMAAAVDVVRVCDAARTSDEHAGTRVVL